MRLAVDRDALLRSIRKDDLPPNPAPMARENIADDALTVVKSGFSALQLCQIPINKSVAYTVRSIPHKVALRRLNAVIRLSIRLQSSNRDAIIRHLETILAEGVAHRLYKLDIKSFYESINTDAILKAAIGDRRIPRHTTQLLSRYFDHLKEKQVDGLPRGISLSATLSEYLLETFDYQISTLPDVYYYARYVDDIIIITGAREDPKQFKKLVTRHLPKPLRFNELKTVCIDLPATRPSIGLSTAGEFNYLGYNISVSNPFRSERKLKRNVRISIAPKKLKKIKSRICCAFCQFIKDRDFSALQRRIQILTGNYNVRDISTGQIRNVGLFCNYRRTNAKDGLKELDSFFRSIAVGNRSRIAKRFITKSTPAQRRTLLRFSFLSSFEKKTFYNFTAAELADLNRCWRNV